jgi:hypothetical protein
MKVKEICACGSSFLAQGDEASALYAKWVKRHKCPLPTEQLEPRDIETSSTIGFSADYSGTGLDLPAKRYDPWEDE